jgi:hypothetical protein
MTPEQARAVHLAYDFLHQYLSCEGVGMVLPNAQVPQLIDGNFRASEDLAGTLAQVGETTFDQVLNDLTQRDEGYPPEPATPMWQSTIGQLKCVRAHNWQRCQDPSSAYDESTALRSSFNLLVALVIQFAAQTDRTPIQTVRLLRDVAAVDTR